MSGVKCATMLLRTAERDITALRYMRDSDEYRPSDFAFRYPGVSPDAEPIDRDDALAVVETLRGLVGLEFEEGEGG